MENFRALQTPIYITLQWETVCDYNYLCKTGVHILSHLEEFWIWPHMSQLSPDNDPIFWWGWRREERRD